MPGACWPSCPTLERRVCFGSGSCVQGQKTLFTYSERSSGSVSLYLSVWTRRNVWQVANCFHLAVAPYRELPRAWVKTLPEAVRACCLRACARPSVLFGHVCRYCCGLDRCGQSSGSFNAGAGASFFICCYNIATHSLYKVSFLSSLCPPQMEHQSLTQ